MNNHYIDCQLCQFRSHITYFQLSLTIIQVPPLMHVNKDAKVKSLTSSPSGSPGDTGLYTAVTVHPEKQILWSLIGSWLCRDRRWRGWPEHREAIEKLGSSGNCFHTLSGRMKRRVGLPDPRGWGSPGTNCNHLDLPRPDNVGAKLESELLPDTFWGRESRREMFQHVLLLILLRLLPLPHVGWTHTESTEREPGKWSPGGVRPPGEAQDWQVQKIHEQHWVLRQWCPGHKRERTAMPRGSQAGCQTEPYKWTEMRWDHCGLASSPQSLKLRDCILPKCPSVIRLSFSTLLINQTFRQWKQKPRFHIIGLPSEIPI